MLSLQSSISFMKKGKTHGINNPRKRVASPNTLKAFIRFSYFFIKLTHCFLMIIYEHKYNVKNDFL